MIAHIIIAIVSAAADPCADVHPIAEPDPVAAEAYRKLAESERAAGSQDTAVAAYRAALEHDGSDSRSRAALAELCGVRRDGDPFAQGVRLMDAGDPRGAIAAFRRARADRRDPSADLLEGICHYQVAEYDVAESLLQTAEAFPAHADVARFYLGLVAMQRGASNTAATYFDALATNSQLGPAAADLARLAQREGKLILSLLAETSWDSNVTLRPDAATSTAQAADGGYALMATVLARPLGPGGLFLRGSGMLHQQLSLGAYNLGGFDAAVGWELGHGGHMLVLEYDYASRTLGGDSYLSAHRLSASGWATLAGFDLAASYFARLDSYAGTWSGFSGVLQRGDLKASRAVLPKLRLGVGYSIGRDSTDTNVLTWFEHGPHAEALLALTRRARLRLDTAVTFRAYDVFDTALSVTRSDTYLDATVSAEYDLGSRWTTRVSLLARNALSNVPDFAYSKFSPTWSLAYVLGI